MAQLHQRFFDALHKLTRSGARDAGPAVSGRLSERTPGRLRRESPLAGAQLLGLSGSAWPLVPQRSYSFAALIARLLLRPFLSASSERRRARQRR